ncbi:MAG TPA: MATE family efflux transporter [Anaerolineales bacterium]|nr:MATE family efflux transporter [Anaerolineales bacterium]HMX73169.1 MATE family efflux transporter [Anaerolineales bacterium]HNB85276.1 MATE family efflux transporter [Anaerolineales bacterium]HND90335.1 MATE family efflux transporter [Anaerolineales bacterium]HNF34498.1 MATE family efflux transporter [Anaerolineales bacterium]
MFNKIVALYSDREYFNNVFKIALPIIFQQFVYALLNMLGVVFVGQKGDTAVAAVGLAGQIAFLLNLVHFGIISGAAMFTAQFWGRQDIPNLKRVLGLCLMFAISASAVFFAISQFVPEWFLGIYSKDPEVIAMGAEYVRTFSWTFLFMAVSASYVFVMRSTGSVKLPTYVSVGVLSLNTLLSYVLIFGYFGMPEMGVQGAAVAAVIARALECVILLYVIYAYKFPVAASIKELTDFDLAFTARVIKPMLPVMLNELFWSLGITTYNAIYGRMGTEALATVNIVSPIEQIAFVVFVGLANATSVLVGNRIGAGKDDEAYLYGGRSIGLGIAGGVLLGLLLQIFKVPALSLFNVSSEVLQNASVMVNIVSIFLWVRVNNMTIVVGILRAGGDTRFSLFLDGIIIWLVGVPFAALGAFYFHLPVYFVYLCVMSEEVTKWILGIFRWRSRKWIHNLASQMEGI